MNRCFLLLVLSAVITLDSRVAAHGEYQEFVRKNSGRPVDCALCHTNSNGPEGTGSGQIGGLSPEEMSRLNFARAAFEPGAHVDSPLLNDFGDLLLQRLGKKRILELRSAPGELANELDLDSDLDQDGVPDAREFLAGTHALIPSDGDPGVLFLHNLRRRWFQVAMLSIATAVTLFGLVNLLHGFAVRLRSESVDGPQRGPR